MKRDRLLARLRAKRRERDAHARECTLWDYESNGGCLDCEQYDVDIWHLKHALAALPE